MHHVRPSHDGRVRGPARRLGTAPRAGSAGHRTALGTLKVRPAAVAGTFYPGDPVVLRDAVEAALQRATSNPSAPPPKAIVVPHAGYMYSGPIAAAAYARVLPRRGAIQQVVVLGPAHRSGPRSTDSIRRHCQGRRGHRA